MSALAERLVAVHEAFDAAGVPHAFGGAIALAYCTRDPRGTTDLDINVFVDPGNAADVIAALPSGVTVEPEDVSVLARDGQVRLWWDNTPVDLFLDVDEFHHEVARRVRVVPFEGMDIPVLDGVSLTVFKAFFNRRKDWVDIESIVDSGTLDGAAALGWLEQLLGADDEVTQRLASLVQ